MTTVIYRFRVADFDAWSEGYGRALAGPLGSDVRTHRVWRGQDDRNLVVLEETFDSSAAAHAAVENPVVAEAMASDGIDLTSLQIDYVDEVSS